MRFDCIHCRKATTKPQSVKGAFLRMLTEDKTLATRKERYTAEAASQFSGKVYVPEDLEEILLRGNE